MRLAVRQHVDGKMSDDEFRQMMETDAFYLAEENGELIGFAQVGLVNSSYQAYVGGFDAQASELPRLYVLSSQQGRGIAAARCTEARTPAGPT
ncbi:MAG: GNAT family N-acetyltransferase [Gammaproteobacteria bacterium]|nr:GNAT family N-acetyltransferase [Gammaproteobacteria bacterium]